MKFPSPLHNLIFFPKRLDTFPEGGVWILNFIHRTPLVITIWILNQVKEQKSKQKPTRFARKLPELDPKTLKLRAKKLEFYLSWAKKYYAEYESL